MFSKAIMFVEVREWYEENGNQTLQIVEHMPEPDRLAWSLSEVLDDVV